MESQVTIQEALQGIKGANWKKALYWLQQAPDAVVLCNASANSCSKAHQWQLALQIASQVTCKRLEATEVTCNTAIQAVVRGASSWHLALHLASNAWQQVRRDAVTWNSAADAVSRKNAGADWALSLKLLDFHHRGLQPDVITQSLRAATLKSVTQGTTLDLWEKALEFAGASLLVTTSALGAFGPWPYGLQLLYRGPPADAQALCAALKVCQESWPWALHLLEAVGRPDVIAMSSAMTALSGAHLWQKALLLFQRLPARSRDVVSYGAAMTAAAIGKHWELGLFWLMEMKNIQLVPNLITYNAAINACEGLHWEHALALLETMTIVKVTPDVISYSSCIAACGQGQRWSDAMNLLDEMKQLQLQRNIIALSSAVSVCEKAGRWELALELLQQSWQLTLEVNTMTYNAAISACEKCSQWDVALNLFSEMEVVQISPSMITSAAVITACAQSAAWVHANALLELQTLQDGDHTARFAAVIASCAANEGAGVATTMPRNLRELSDTNEVLALELLDNHDTLNSMSVARLQRTMWHPMLQRCIALRSFQAVKGWRLYDEILERESFLGTIFTMDTLDHLKMVIPSGRFWLSRARRHARDVHAQTTMPTLEPKSKGIVAWAAIHLQQRGDTVQCSGRIHEWSWNWGSSDLLVPVFVEHDRSPHAERQALLTCLHTLKG